MAAAAAWLGYSLGTGAPSIDLTVALLGLAAFLVCAGGQAINDYYDRETDAIRKKKKPIPSGRVKAGVAFIYAIALSVIGVIVAAHASIEAGAFALAFAVLLYAYSALLRKAKWLGNWVVALSTGSVIAFGAIPTGNYELALPLAVAAILANAGREIAKDLEDQRSDRGFKTTLPMVIGKVKTKYAAISCNAGASAMAIAPALCGPIAMQLLVAAGVAALAFASAKLYSDYPASQKASKVAMLLVMLAYATTLF
jgi:geranylgeranylglycerol-phosphate geranylgeranyltransferase